MTQTEKPEIVNKILGKRVITDMIRNNIRAAKNYWPIMIALQLPAILLYGYFSNSQERPPQTSGTLSNQKYIDLNKKQSNQISALEQRLNKLNQRFLALQNQHAKVIKSLINFKSASIQPAPATPTNIVAKTTLEILDRIGEKIRLNEPFSGLLAALPKSCTTLPGYKTLQQFSTRLPLTFAELKRTFEDIKKNYTPPKTSTNLPKWLDETAALFHGRIKIEKSNQAKTDPLKPIHDALEMQNLDLAFSCTKNVDIPSVKSWAKLAAERIVLEKEYCGFAEKVLILSQQTNEPQPANPTTQEKNP